MVREYSLYDFSALRLLRLVLWPNAWFLLDNVPCAPGKGVHSAGGGLFCEAQQSTALLKSSASLLEVCLMVLHKVQHGSSELSRWACLFLSSVLSVFLPRFEGSVLRRMYVYGGCVFSLG